MEEQLFSLDDFVIAPKANPRSTTDKAEKKVPEFNVKVNFKTRHISFDTVIANQINLANNSLAHAKSEKTGVIAIIVVPGDQGVFAKRVARGTNKGTSFKNKLLIQNLVELNLTSGKYKLEKLTTSSAKVGDAIIENCDWYKLVMVGEPQIIDLTEKEEKEPEALTEVTVEEEATDEVEVPSENKTF